MHTYFEFCMQDINSKQQPIKLWSEDDRPREKLLRHGSDSLSTTELLAIIINHGSGNHSAVDLARLLLQKANNQLGELVRMSVPDLQKIKGIGPAKAVSIKAALQLAITLQREGMQNRKRISSSKDLVDYLRQELQHLPHEEFVVVFLDKANKVLSFQKLSRGGISGTVVDSRLIFRKALEERACSIILSHNHPSGNLNPSNADVELTRKLKQAGSLMDINVLDHLIVSNEGYYSFADEGLL